MKYFSTPYSTSASLFFEYGSKKEEGTVDFLSRNTLTNSRGTNRILSVEIDPKERGKKGRSPSGPFPRLARLAKPFVAMKERRRKKGEEKREERRATESGAVDRSGWGGRNNIKMFGGTPKSLPTLKRLLNQNTNRCMHGGIPSRVKFYSKSFYRKTYFPGKNVNLAYLVPPFLSKSAIRRFLPRVTAPTTTKMSCRRYTLPLIPSIPSSPQLLAYLPSGHCVIISREETLKRQEGVLRSQKRPLSLFQNRLF